MQGTAGRLAVLPEHATVLDTWLAFRLSVHDPSLQVSRLRGTGAQRLDPAASGFLDDVAALLRDAALREWEAADPAGAAVTSLPEAPAIVLTPCLGPVADLPLEASRTLLQVCLGAPDSPWGPWSAVQAVARDSAEWIGAHILLYRPAGPVLAWRGTPQVSAGDSAAMLTARALIEASEALEDHFRHPGGAGEPASTRRVSTPEAADWERYERLGKGTRSPLTWERALR
jgi:hypothetical protein